MRQPGLALVALLSLFASPLFANPSNSLVDVSPDGKRLLVANADNGTVSIVDTEKKTVLHEIKLGKKPEGVSWLGGSALGIVTVYEESSVVLVDAEKGGIVA